MKTFKQVKLILFQPVVLIAKFIIILIWIQKLKMMINLLEASIIKEVD